MALTVNQRKTLVQDMLDEGKISEDQIDFVSGLTDNVLVALNSPEDLDELVDFVANASKDDEEEEEEEEEEEDEDNDDGEEEEEEEEITDNKLALKELSDEELEAEMLRRKKPVSKKPKGKAPVTNSKLTEDEWLTAAPSSYKRIIANHEAREEELRSDLIEKITSNSANDFTEDQLEQTPIETLQSLAKLATASTPTANYAGRGARNLSANSAEESPLVTRDIWAE